jgi:ribonuclease HII
VYQVITAPEVGQKVDMTPVRKFDPDLIPDRPDLHFEIEIWDQGIKFIAGVDEAGRGALAGPVSSGVVILPGDITAAQKLSGVRDSKQMTPTERERWAAVISSTAITFGIGFASNLEIDELGIVPATRLAVQRAVKELAMPPQHMLVDYLEIPELDIPQTSLIKGDMRSLSVAAASVLAKVARDEEMCRLHTRYPDYGFARHKGYGTQEHRDAILALGLSPVHRTSFHLKSYRDDFPSR